MLHGESEIVTLLAKPCGVALREGVKVSRTGDLRGEEDGVRCEVMVMMR